MTDIFISYATEDRELAAALAKKLETNGYEVWWDRELIAGASFRDTIVKQLEQAEFIVVLWSPQSVKSQWVVDEADTASTMGKLLPVRTLNLPIVDIPLGHRQHNILEISDLEGILRSVRQARVAKGIKPAGQALKRGGQVLSYLISATNRYSYEYGLHIAMCFIAIPIFLEIFSYFGDFFVRDFKFDVLGKEEAITRSSVWLSMAIFVCSLGWSSMISWLFRMRYDHGIFLVIIVSLAISLFVYALSRENSSIVNNYDVAIRWFFGVGFLIWLIFLFREIRKEFAAVR